MPYYHYAVISFSNLKAYELGLFIFILRILCTNFLLFACCLNFCNILFSVLLHCWIRKWHQFPSIRSGFCAKLFKKKSNLVIKVIAFLWHYQLIFVDLYHRKYTFKRKSVSLITYVDCLIETSIRLS